MHTRREETRLTKDLTQAYNKCPLEALLIVKYQREAEREAQKLDDSILNKVITQKELDNAKNGC